MSEDGEVVAYLNPGELSVIQLMRESAAPDVDFEINRRDGKIVNAKTIIRHDKKFRNRHLREIAA